MKGKLAVVFPGQGSQKVGMGEDLYRERPEARALFRQADEVLGFDLSGLVFRGPEGALGETINTQPAIFTTSIACWAVLRAQGLPNPAFVAGHSLGEYTALVAAEALPFTEALLLVRERGRLMKEAGERRPGGMAAILGLDEATVEEICAQEEVAVANYNCPGQVVISGAREALERALQAAQEKGARRVVPLAVSIAAHSPLIAPIAEAFARCLASISFQRARIPILANLTAQPIASPQELKDELSRQLTSPVRWSESVQRMIREGVNTFLEVGPGEVLKGLIKRIDQEVRAVSAFDLEGVERALALVAMEELG